MLPSIEALENSFAFLMIVFPAVFTMRLEYIIFTEGVNNRYELRQLQLEKQRYFIYFFTGGLLLLFIVSSHIIVGFFWILFALWELLSIKLVIKYPYFPVSVTLEKEADTAEKKGKPQLSKAKNCEAISIFANFNIESYQWSSAVTNSVGIKKSGCARKPPLTGFKKFIRNIVDIPEKIRIYLTPESYL